MTINAEGGSSILGGFRDDLKALSTKQIIAIIAAIAIALILAVLGLATTCFGFLIIAVVLYMIPHMLGVTSAKVKALVGVAFVVLALLVGTFAYGTQLSNINGSIDSSSMDSVEVTYSETESTYYLTFRVNPSAAGIETDSEGNLGNWDVRVGYADVSRISFGQATATSSNSTIETLTSEMATSVSEGWYTFTVALDNMGPGVYEYVQIALDSVADNGVQTALKTHAFTYNTGISSGSVYSLTFMGSLVSVAEIALLFFIILGFSAMMRRSATKTRDRMEAEGRLYPQGYGRCKECGAMVLPGEVVCRKCGAYIDVPEEMRPKKKDYVTCSECGAEVPADADTCPRCGARFDEEDVVEVAHVDGTVDETSETVPCPHCGESIPANAGWCPKCGKKVRE